MVSNLALYNGISLHLCNCQKAWGRKNWKKFNRCQIVGSWPFCFANWYTACKLLYFWDCRKMTLHIWPFEPTFFFFFFSSEVERAGVLISLYLLIFFFHVSFSQILWLLAWNTSPTALLQRLAGMICLFRFQSLFMKVDHPDYISLLWVTWLKT